jgi:predicted secreted protein
VSLALTTRPLTTAERAELEARHAALVARYSEDDESHARAKAGAAWSILWFGALFGVSALSSRSEAEVEAEPPVGRPQSGPDAKRPGFGFNVHSGHLDAALVAGVVAVFIGSSWCADSTGRR